MTLANMIWKRVSVHEVVADFLRGDQFTNTLPQTHQQRVAQLCKSPNFGNPQENHERLRYLLLIRGRLIGEIPPDTKWYEVQRLTDNELNELQVIARCNAYDPNEKGDLLAVAGRSPQPLRNPPSKWDRPILWGHDKTGPFTIIEGNNRLISYASSNPRSGLAIPVLVGLSPTPCFWHIFDQCGWLANDLWK